MTTMQRYEILHYRGDLTGQFLLDGDIEDDTQPRTILGGDETTRPYEVFDAEYDPDPDLTTVHLRYAHNASIVGALMAGGRVVRS